MRKEKKIRLAPQSKESEMMVLGSMLTSLGSLNIASDLLKASDFYYREHQLIFECLYSLYQEDKPADVHILSELLKTKEKLEEVGGISYLTLLAQYAGTSAYVEEYAKIVKDKAMLRQMIQAAQEIEKKALEEKEEVSSLLDVAQSHFFHISQSASSDYGVLLSEILSGAKAEKKLPYLKELEERQKTYLERGPQALRISGTPTRFTDLDKMVHGFHPSNFMILAARPAMGKTALAINIAENICFKNDVPVGIFSLEMSAEQLMHRIICSQAEVESDKILNGSLNGIEYQKVVASVKKMQKHVMLIDDQPGLKITDLRARARRMKEAYNIGFLVIDYLQLLSGSGTSRSLENRQMEISEISRLLKTLARELNIPILCAAQLSRKVEERHGHRPMMSDLRESGCLAGDTEIVEADTGRIYTIQELAERKEQKPIYVYGINEDLQLGKYPLIKAFDSGEKKVYQLITSSFSIEASANHPFRTATGWTPLEKLTPGDRIVTLRKKREKEAFSLFSSQGGTSVQEKTSVEKELAWEEILSIEEIGIKPVFDATVEEVHNFVANGMIVHNSLEQDTDLILFLLRRDYYDPYDKPGMAELIVAKNRHGAIGTVNLVFRKEYAQFKDYIPIQEGEITENEAAFAAFSPE